jgi:hypothetical protein
MKRERRPIWLKLGILGILLFLAAYGLVALEAQRKDREGPVRCTTYSTAAGGYKILYLWLRELGVPVRRWEKPLDDLPPAASVLMIVEPELGPGTGELKALRGWVYKGGTLILVVRPPNVFLKQFGLEQAVYSDHNKEDEDQSVLFQPGPYTQGVQTILYRGYPKLTSDRPEVIFHARDTGGGLLAIVQEGKGRVIALADPTLFCNKSLKDGDHSRLALNMLLAHHTEGTLLIDEYHHGYGRATSVLGHLARSRALEPLLQGVLLLLILWAAWGRRFGSPRPLVKEEQRSSMQYVGAMAQLFQKAQARGLAIKSVTRWIEDEAKKLLVDKDHTFQMTLQAAQGRVKEQKITDRELLVQVRNLYRALDGARSRALFKT